MILQAHQMLRRPWLAIAAAFLALPARLAMAEEASVASPQKDALEPVNLMAATAPARLSGAPFTVTTWAGYDGAISSPRVTASIEAALVRRLALAVAVGTDSPSDSKGQLSLRPMVALRFQAFEQDTSGVDATAAVAYRQDRFDLDGGFVQGSIALGRSFDRLLVALNVTYGMDPEGDDFEGEVCAAARFEVRPRFYLGVDGRYRHDLGSTDPNRAERDRSESETLAGATAAYSSGRWAVMLEAGISQIVTTSAQTAPVVLGGYTALF